MTLSQAIVSAAQQLDEAEREIVQKGIPTHGMRPSKATVTFDLLDTRGQNVNASLSVAPPTSPVGGGLGWSASKQTQTGNHISIDFSPRN